MSNKKRVIHKTQHNLQKPSIMVTHASAAPSSNESLVYHLPSPSPLISKTHDNDDDDHDHVDDDDKPDIDELSSDDIEPFTQSICIGKMTKYLLFGLAVLIGQIAISVSLKRYGIIDKDFNELVTERVVPRLQNGLLESIPQQFNESLYWIRSFDQTFPLMTGTGTMMMMTTTATRIRPGFQLAQKGAQAKYPIIMIPGFVTSGLEVWQGKECAKPYFRQRLWGGVGMVQQWFTNRHCAMEHMGLDLMTGKDPENIRIRPASGFESADYFAGNYWVWSKLLMNLADIGYDGNMMSMESYDWRLSFPMLEERDGYLTKLKFRIEAFVNYSGNKVVIASHSMGGLLVNYFFAWVVTPKEQGGGGGGKDWVHNHIHSYINVAGAHLGVPKSASSLLSGEMSDTVAKGPLGGLIEQFLGRKVRKDLWTTWGSLWSLLPKGGARLWNVGADLKRLDSQSEESIDGDDQEDYMIFLTDEETIISNQDTSDRVIPVADNSVDSTVGKAIQEFSSRKLHTLDDVTGFLKKWGGGWGPKIASARWHSFDPTEKHSPATWHDVTRTPLPHAPNMKIYCLYGVGIDTERAYFYKRNTGDGGTENQSESRTPLDPPFILDSSVEDPTNKVIHGVRYADGDGSVPLLSLGYMCADGWRRKETKLNPSMSKIVTREYEHKPELVFDDPMRGGPYSGEHVDIMGNLDMMEDFLKVVSDFEEDTLDDRVVSDIFDIADRIARHPNGGLSHRRRRFHFW